LIGAGAIIKRLPGRLSPEASVAVAAFESVGNGLRDQLLQCSLGRELAERGFAADVELAAELDVSQTVKLLTREAFVAATAAGQRDRVSKSVCNARADG
jgi:2-phosphosulfolactate phosphatase